MLRQFLEDCKRECLDRRLFNRRGDIGKANIHDFSMEFFRNIDVLQQANGISFNGVMQPGLLQVPDDLAEMFFYKPGMGDRCISDRFIKFGSWAALANLWATGITQSKRWAMPTFYR